MLTKSVAAILLASLFTFSVSIARAEASMATSGSASEYAEVAGVDLRGPDFNVEGDLWWTGDIGPDWCSYYGCPLSSWWMNTWWNTYSDTRFWGTLTWQGVSNQLYGSAVSAGVYGEPSIIQLPSESGTWHVDLPSTLWFSLPDLSFSTGGTGIRPVDIACDAGVGTCHVYGSVVYLKPVLACDGFVAPADVPISLPSRGNRVIPLRMTLREWFANTPITDADIPDAAPPTVEISFSAGQGSPIDVSSQAASPGNKDSSFTYDPATNAWQLNLSTKPYMAAGTYIVRVKPGSPDYAIIRNDFDPTCEARFVRN